MPSKKFTKICSICGEKAIGYNFCAISCESCKAFFRRNATKLDEYKCPFDDKCKVNVVTRKFCRKCRLRKCYAVGMKQEWILNDEEKEVRKNKIEENRKLKELNDKKSTKTYNESSIASSSPQTSYTDTTGEDSTIADVFDTNTITDDEIITNLMDIETYISPTEDSTESADNILAIPETNTIVEEDEISDRTYQKAVELELAVLPIPRTINDYTTLNEVECNRMIELFSIQMSLNRPQPQNKLEAQTVEDVINFFVSRFEVYVQRFVDTTKSLSAFNDICENDQIALIKYSSLETLLLRTALTFDYQHEFWTFYMDEDNSIILKLDLLKPVKRDCYTHFRTFLQKFGSEWDSDPFIIDLLMPIILFNPDRPNIIHRELVKVQQQIYMYLLQRYLRLRYSSECETKAKFLRILNVLEYLEKLDEVNKLNYRECENHNEFGPLFREVFDIPANDKALTAS
ncbi:unnamed protein product [Oppiella nova]|uniref:Uncharacterized protein n=1 Tax=Oppiella nova TaxID=334625 RepID=A0A7R9M9A0_9ACAR|nr:unnamed protein product [Oppiella nova]CAG2173097.1 unnamed protein product [Oppiella nova]